MNSVETILSTKIKEVEPALDILGSDYKILQIAHQDFVNYLKFTFQSEKTLETDYNQKVQQLINEDANEFESFLTIWIGNWLNKWKERVKLVFGNNNHEKECTTLAKAHCSAAIEYRWENVEQKQEMLDMITSTLIRNAETCCTQLLAENILKKETSKIKKPQINGREQVFSILNSVLRQAREVAHNTGPLIFLNVDKGYFRSPVTIQN